MNIGQRIAYLRERKGLSQPQLAKDLNVATSTIGMWETGKRGLKDETIKMLADYFGVTSDYLLGIDSNLTQKVKSKPETIAAHIDDDVTKEEMEDILNYIEFIKNKHRK
ncbi:XRE family transcriptional regulator [Vagococcus penaei]|uniref:helix-turn-helix domain-containing protein n=1 Tax=Vagococcus penaei TaxID=633807 RepID=UPI000F872C3B|nr:helix-turn-helix transcriptional regulator [Vagococcus penaei]RSU01436.1 XRE family transcriptional regulator [Vagococcus penaei]